MAGLGKQLRGLSTNSNAATPLGGRRAGLQLSINISAAYREESDFAAQVQLYLLKHQVRPDMLEFEVTESVVMKMQGTRSGSSKHLKK